jgi:hypothetical protein
LRKLSSKFFKAAMASEGQNVFHMAVAYCRISGRRSELSGGNAPASYAVTLVQKSAPPEMTSTERTQDAYLRPEWLTRCFFLNGMKTA